MILYDLPDGEYQPPSILVGPSKLWAWLPSGIFANMAVTRKTSRICVNCGYVSTTNTEVQYTRRELK
jgi:hypothetical protein